MIRDEQTTTSFFVDVTELLNAREGVDADLAKIVSQHLLTASPSEHCVQEALQAMNGLAAERASFNQKDVDE